MPSGPLCEVEIGGSSRRILYSSEIRYSKDPQSGIFILETFCSETFRQKLGYVIQQSRKNLENDRKNLEYKILLSGKTK